MLCQQKKNQIDTGGDFNISEYFAGFSLETKSSFPFLSPILLFLEDRDPPILSCYTTDNLRRKGPEIGFLLFEIPAPSVRRRGRMGSTIAARFSFLLKKPFPVSANSLHCYILPFYFAVGIKETWENQRGNSNSWILLLIAKKLILSL